HLNPEFGDLMLREITVERAQNYFARLQRTSLAAESLDKIRDVMSAVLGAAVDFNRLVTNPVAKIRLKKRRINKPKPFLRIAEFYALMDSLPEPYATMVYVAAFTGLRVSELAGLKWRCVGEDSITVEER